MTGVGRAAIDPKRAECARRRYNAARQRRRSAGGRSARCRRSSITKKARRSKQVTRVGTFEGSAAALLKRLAA